MCNAKNEPNQDLNQPKPKTPEERYNDFLNTYNGLFKGKKFILHQLHHERPVKEEIPKGRIKDKKGNDRKLCHVEYSSCKECEDPLVAIDHHRGERVCECGMTNRIVVYPTDYVFDNTTDSSLFKQNTPGKLRTSEDSLTHEEARVLKHIHRNDKKKKITTVVREQAKKEAKNGGKINRVQVKTPQKDYNKKQYAIAVEIMASQLLMTGTQINDVKQVINKYPLTMIHSRVNHKTTIAGICRYILMKDNRGRELRFNRSAFDFVGLNESNYNVIKTNLKRLGI